MSFDITIAVVPNDTNLTTEMRYIKTALLYADKINLISPKVYLFNQFTNDLNPSTEKSLLHLFDRINCIGALV